ncbi:MAG TPA: hypothetical protein VM285_06260 [Polyangia bacterium]|nr:hypothetical protein [Polyangia bacterium]
MNRLVPILLLAVASGCCETPPPAPPPAPPAKCECPPTPPSASDCADLAAALESCQARLNKCEQDPFKGGKYLLGDEPATDKPDR